MAKSKKPKKAVEEEIVEEPETEDAEPEVEAEAEDANADDADAEVEAVEGDAEDVVAEDEGAEEEKPEADEDVAGDDGDKDKDEDEESIDETPAKPSPKIATTALVLIFLNIIATLSVFVLVYLDHMARARDAYRTTINYVKIWGLPLKEEEAAASLTTVTRPVNRLTPEQLEKAFKERRTGKSINPDKFQNIEEETTLHLRPSDMTENVVDDVFGGIPNHVKTLDEEIERLKTDIPTKIAGAATEVADTLLKKPEADKRTFAKEKLAISGDAAQVKAVQDQIDAASGAALDDFVKRTIVHRTLFTIAFNVFQVDELDKKLNAAKGADLDNLVKDSIQRRLYYDILAPTNIFRPGEMSDPKAQFEIEKMADPKVSLDDIKKMLEKRLDATIGPKYVIQPTKDASDSDAVEKRKHIGFILFTLGQVQKPLLGTKLYDKGLERAQVISGLYEFTDASLAYVRAIDVLDTRIANAAHASRQGWNYLKDGKEQRTPGAIDKIELEIDRLDKIRQRVHVADKRLIEVKKQRDLFNKMYEERAMQYKDTLDRLLTERKKTEKLVKELRELQVQLHEALLNLADAGERNFQLEAEIRAIELEYIRKTQPKGTKKP